MWPVNYTVLMNIMLQSKCVTKLLTPYFSASVFFKYSARILIEAQIIEAAAYCYHLLMVPLYVNSTQNTLVH